MLCKSFLSRILLSVFAFMVPPTKGNEIVDGYSKAELDVGIITIYDKFYEQFLPPLEPVMVGVDMFFEILKFKDLNNGFRLVIRSSAGIISIILNAYGDVLMVNSQQFSTYR